MLRAGPSYPKTQPGTQNLMFSEPFIPGNAVLFFRPFCSPQTFCIFRAFCSPQTLCVYSSPQIKRRKRGSNGQKLREGQRDPGRVIKKTWWNLAKDCWGKILSKKAEKYIKILVRRSWIWIIIWQKLTWNKKAVRKNPGRIWQNLRARVLIKKASKEC